MQTLSLGQPTRRRGTGLVRSLIVSVATLAILLVCFAIYQYTQIDAPAVATQRKPRLPETPTRPLNFDNDSEETAPPGVDIGPEGVIGPGEKLKITVYERDSDRARFEIEVDDLTPVTGSTNEFLLTSPDVRMRTKDGHAVRVSARRGLLEARREPGGALDPQRGWLTGEVVIQYDRLSEADRAKLPEAQRGQIDPSQLIEITMNEIEFDLEYAKLIVPGALHLSGSDVQLWATDLEIRFNEAENRVEYMRVTRGGKLELTGRGERFGLGLPGGEVSGRARFTLMDWLRSTLEARLEAQQGKSAAHAPVAARPQLAYTDEGVPIFRQKDSDVAVDEAPLRYYARFDGSVVAQQEADGLTRAHLRADVLEILREFSGADRSRVWSPTRPPAEDVGAEATPGGGRFLLTWTERLAVETCAPGDARCEGEGPARLTAVGAPVRFQRTGADVACRRMTYDPAGTRMSLFGTATDPAVARFDDRGIVSGVEIHSERHDDDMIMRVAGPGTLTRGSAKSASAADPSGKAPSHESVVTFSGGLDVRGRIVTRPRINGTDLVALTELRVLDRALFDGRVTVAQDDTQISADWMTVNFSSLPALFGTNQDIRHVVGRGSVEMTQAGDRLACNEIDVTLEPGGKGRAVPRQATATGDVLVEREDGSTIQAKDRLIVDFANPQEADEPVASSKPAAPDATRRAVGTPGSATLRSEATEEEASARGMTLRRLQAFGDVAVRDPATGLHVSAQWMDCAVINGRDIDTASIHGSEGHAALVQLDTLTIGGQEILLNVPRETVDVPGAGRLSFRTTKDLSGRKIKEPIPVVVTWSERMAYRGVENRAVFDGNVHAASQATTSFDARRLEVEFEDVATAPPPPDHATPGGLLASLIERITPVPNAPGDKPHGLRIGKEPIYLLATGDAIAMTSELDPATGGLLSRSRIAGPRLSVNLRSDVSKMIIEGPGNLLLEDNRPPDPSAMARSSQDRGGSLFTTDMDGGPSNTLIEWNDLMWYDFAINQTRFEGNVRLKHFSGAQLLQLRPDLFAEGSDVRPGRATYLNSDVLTVDFLDRQKRTVAVTDRRMGRLSAERLEQFEATGTVRLRDESEGLSLTARRVVYWKERDTLAVYGTAHRKAIVVIQKPGELPNQLAVERLFYNLKAGTWELKKPALTSR